MEIPQIDPKSISITDFFADVPHAQYRENNEYFLAVKNLAHQEKPVKIIFDIYPYSNPSHPERHLGYYTVKASLPPESITKIKIVSDWNQSTFFSINKKSKKAEDYWLGNFKKEGSYKLYLTLLSEREKMLDQTFIIQDLSTKTEKITTEIKNSQNLLFVLLKGQTLHPSPNKSVLMIGNELPYYDRDSGSLRMYNILKLLLQLKFHIVYFAYESIPEPKYIKSLRKRGIDVLLSSKCHKKDFLENSLRDFLIEFGNSFGTIYLSRPEAAIKSIDIIQRHCNKAKLIYDTVDLHFLRTERRSAIENDPAISKLASSFRKKELFLCDQSDMTIVISKKEKQILQGMRPSAKIKVIPNIHSPHPPVNPFNKRKNLLFIGWFGHTPNEDSLLYFSEEIYPLIIKTLPSVKLYVVGGGLPKKIQKLKSRNIILTGQIENISSYFENSRVFIAPLRYGSGMKGKIGQSMSFGLPVVTTPIGAEGFRLKNNSTGIIAGNAEEFAQGVIRLYEDRNLWEEISKNSFQYVKQNFSPEMIEPEIKKMFRELLDHKSLMNDQPTTDFSAVPSLLSSQNRN